ncbi:MAG: mucoidy inhibitor MuiA family protein [Bacteroidota bacterium]
MKKNVLFFIILLYAVNAGAQVTSKEVVSKVTDVTVYMTGASITHTADVTLAKGDYNLQFSGISPNINQKSVQVSANENVKITSVTYVIDYLAVENESKEIQVLNDSLDLLAKKITTLKNQLSVYASEKELVLKNYDLKGTTTGVSTVELQKAADFYRLRLTEINTLTEKLNDQKEIYNELYTKIQKQLTTLNSKKGEPVYKLSVTASVKAATTSSFTIKYLVTNAGWAAFYDIRATDVSKPIELDYKAKVYNNCSIGWSNVKLTLSTADPSQTAQRPTLTAWGLNYSYDIYNEEKENNYNTTVTNTWNYMAADTSKVTTGTKSWNNQYTTIEVSELSVEFEITTLYTIPSDNKVYFVDIQTQEMPATYKYIAIPKLDNDAFLVANITGWESMNLIEGTANIFYAGTYVGQSYLSTKYASDTLEISLGRDKKVSVSRVKKEDFSGKTFMGGNMKEKLTYEIKVRNNNTAAIEITVQDQVPISQQEDIKVDVLETTDVTPDPLSGKLVYNFKLDPSASKVITISFSVQYPKSKASNLKLNKTRTISCPSF